MEWCMLVVHTYVVHTQCAMYSSCVCWYGMCIYVRRYSRTTVYQYILRVCSFPLHISILYFSSSSGMFYFVSYSASSNR